MKRILPLALSSFALLFACGGSSQNGNPPAVASTTTPPVASTTDAPVASASASTPPAPVEEPPKVVDKVDVPPAIAAIVGAKDRSEDDKKMDAGRHPAETLAFFGIAPGMKVGEIESGGGYTTELLARAVAPNGVVYGENPKFVIEKFAAKPWAARLAKPVNKLVVRSDRELEDPFPAEAKDLDAVVDVLFYHDTVWLGADRDKMNTAIFNALKHGGVYGIVDHAAKEGHGVDDAKTFHRIEEKVVIAEVKKAGFKLEAEATFLKNPNDTHDWNDSPKEAGDKRGTSDRFVLKFVKP